MLLKRPVPSCTAPLGLLDSIPAEVLPGLLTSSCLEAADFARCAATCSAFAHLVTRDPSSDARLWEPACLARWATKAYDPLLLHPSQLEGLSHRERYIWAERDGARTLGTGVDLCNVFAWSISTGGPDYTIEPFPYRLNGTYVSRLAGPRRATPGLAGTYVSRYKLVRAVGSTSRLVVIDGLPAARLVRREDWGWELRNHLLVARSVTHRAQPDHYVDTR